jgi:hypothetical protein
VLIAISLAIRPRDIGPDAWWFGDWTRSEWSRNAWALFAVRDSSFVVRDAWEIADVRERARAVVSTGAAPMGLTIRADATVPAAVAAAFTAHIREEFRALAPTPRHAVIVLILIDSMPRSSVRIGVARPTGIGAPCVVQVRIPTFHEERARPATDDQLLSTCGLYARFGPVGTGMERWLERSGMRTAARHTARALDAPRRNWSPSANDLARDPLLFACLAGRLARCRLIFDGESAPLPGAVFGARTGPNVARRLTNSQRIGVFPAGGTGHLLAALRATLGDDRFAMLWSSEQDPYATFTANEHRPLEALLSASLRTSLGWRPAPTRLQPRQVARLLALIGAAVAATVRWSRADRLT